MGTRYHTRVARDGAATLAQTGQRPSAHMPFRFFDLPLELRDWIYDSLAGDEELVEGTKPDGYKIAVRGHPMLNVLLANRQLKREYELRAAKFSPTAVLLDHADYELECHCNPPSWKGKITQVKRVEIRCFARCDCADSTAYQDRCDVLEQVQDIACTTSKALEVFPHLESVTVDIGVWWRSSAGGRWSASLGEAAWPKSLASVHHVGDISRGFSGLLLDKTALSRVRVHRSEPGNEDASTIAQGPLEATWTMADGWRGVAPETGTETKTSVANGSGVQGSVA